MKHVSMIIFCLNKEIKINFRHIFTGSRSLTIFASCLSIPCRYCKGRITNIYNKQKNCKNDILVSFSSSWKNIFAEGSSQWLFVNRVIRFLLLSTNCKISLYGWWKPIETKSLKNLKLSNNTWRLRPIDLHSKQSN